ncbi:pyridoxamine 5-phosphate oxidase [Actinotalea ferrariae CF5-4]|uniref:Pyridoxamine 5-phosphate oxidase n=1 Tax=Actinotalea ferrariae CF5-4 TaxID=948458 RepID=A0A021VRE3_9CELL|nr:pyridoxamine 5'-phosphate oxidase family protein [Actinotalea ferrariae]EYR63706.1 pyridoxamine 5-phosphate oxidase [Actinotalea ferrariae CF5-4]
MDPTEKVQPLTDAESWEVLRGQALGRLAYQVAGEVFIVPVNFVVDGDRVVFRTAEGNKLFGTTVNHRVAFEVDDVEADHAVSVVARGLTRHLTGAAAEEAEGLPLHPWVGTEKHEFVAITVEELTGRRFRVDLPGSDEPSI